MNVIIRSNVVEFTTAFFGEDGLPMNPASAVLKLVVGGVETSISMSQSGDEWSAQWDSTGAPVGYVFWAVQASAPHAADQGKFYLTANLANA